MKIKKIMSVMLAVMLAVMCCVVNVSAADAAKLSETSVSVEVGSTYQLYVDRATQSISWATSNKAIATVSNGKITAKKAGTVTITANHGKTPLKCKVTVVKKGSLKETTIKMTKYYVAKDYKGNDMLVLEFDFTNNEKDTESFGLFAYVQVFQNGIECDSAISMDVDTSNSYKDIKPGTTIHAVRIFKLTDNSPVDVEVKELIGGRVFINKTINLK